MQENMYDKAKGVLLTTAIILGGAGGTILIGAETYFDLMKGIVCVVLTLGIVSIYRLLRRK